MNKKILKLMNTHYNRFNTAQRNGISPKYPYVEIRYQFLLIVAQI